MDEIKTNKTEVIVVGGGPAGIASAITIARAGHEVILIERGNFAGSKNVFGGAIYAQPTREIFPNFEQEAPIERLNIEHKFAILGKEDSTTISYRHKDLENPSYTVIRGKFDRWMADEASLDAVKNIAQNIVILEHVTEVDFMGYEVLKQKKYGDKYITFLHRL